MVSTMLMTSFTSTKLTCTIQPPSRVSVDEKLGTIWVWFCICHGQDSRTWMLQDEVLMLKYIPADGLANSSIMVCEVTTLAHECWNTIEGETLYPNPFSSVPITWKFSTVFETLSANSSKQIWHKCLLSALISKNTLRLKMSGSK